MNFSTYISPFTWRYGTDEMRQIFSEEYKYKTWRKIWLALARAQNKAGLVSDAELKDLQKHVNSLDISAILEFEKETKHDLFAAIKEYAAKTDVGGGKIHLGATSMDIVDNTDVIKMKEGLKLIRSKLQQALHELTKKIKIYAEMPCMAYTHLQPAEPTTVGYRFAMYAQDLFLNLQYLDFVLERLKGKGMKGAVGTSASYTQLLKNTKTSAAELEAHIMQELDLEAALIASQVYPRQYDFLVISVLSAIGGSLAKFAADLRILQSPTFGEWSEPFGKKQVGSSAMPFKRNPITSEKICSLSRYLMQLPQVALENGALSYLERTLDDSANKRVIIPEAFLTADEILESSLKLLTGMVINEKRIEYNLQQYGPFSASETILMECVKKGADRQELHEVLKITAMQAWAEIQEGKKNRMKELLSNNKEIKKYLSEKEISQCFSVENHIGDAPQRALALIKIINQKV